MNILQRIAALCGRDYVLRHVDNPNKEGCFLMRIVWFDNWPWAYHKGVYYGIAPSYATYLTPRIKQWEKARETTRRLEGEAKSKTPQSVGVTTYGVDIEQDAQGQDIHITGNKIRNVK